MVPVQSPSVAEHLEADTNSMHDIHKENHKNRSSTTGEQHIQYSSKLLITSEKNIYLILAHFAITSINPQKPLIKTPCSTLPQKPRSWPLLATGGPWWAFMSRAPQESRAATGHHKYDPTVPGNWIKNMQHYQAVYLYFICFKHQITVRARATCIK